MNHDSVYKIAVAPPKNTDQIGQSRSGMNSYDQMNLNRNRNPGIQVGNNISQHPNLQVTHNNPQNYHNSVNVTSQAHINAYPTNQGSMPRQLHNKDSGLENSFLFLRNSLSKKPTSDTKLLDFCQNYFKQDLVTVDSKIPTPSPNYHCYTKQNNNLNAQFENPQLKAITQNLNQLPQVSTHFTNSYQSPHNLIQSNAPTRPNSSSLQPQNLSNFPNAHTPNLNQRSNNLTHQKSSGTVGKNVFFTVVGDCLNKKRQADPSELEQVINNEKINKNNESQIRQSHEIQAKNEENMINARQSRVPEVRGLDNESPEYVGIIDVLNSIASKFKFTIIKFTSKYTIEITHKTKDISYILEVEKGSLILAKIEKRVNNNTSQITPQSPIEFRAFMRDEIELVFM